MEPELETALSGPDGATIDILLEMINGISPELALIGSESVDLPLRGWLDSLARLILVEMIETRFAVDAEHVVLGNSESSLRQVALALDADRGEIADQRD